MNKNYLQNHLDRKTAPCNLITWTVSSNTKKKNHIKTPNKQLDKRIEALWKKKEKKDAML